MTRTEVTLWIDELFGGLDWNRNRRPPTDHIKETTMGILQAIMMALGIINSVVPLVSKAEKAFSGKKGSGKAKKKLVMDATKALVAKSKLGKAEQKALILEASKTVDTVVATSKVVNALKKK